MSLWQFQFKQWLLCPRVILRCRISTGSDFLGGEADHSHSRSKADDTHYVDTGLAFQSNSASRPHDSMIKVMDDLNALMILMNQMTPGPAQWQKEEEKQLKDKDFSQSKVFVTRYDSLSYNRVTRERDKTQSTR
jgi:hypothetical protein